MYPIGTLKKKSVGGREQEISWLGEFLRRLSKAVMISEVKREIGTFN